MFDNLITAVLRQRAFVIIAALTLLGYGLHAFQQISIEAFPDVQDVQVLVVTQAPGQAPEEVERAITLPIEREMSGVPGLTQLRSVSITGLSVVTLTFNEKTADYFARQQVLERLQTVNLPDGVQPGLAPLTTAVGEIYRYVLESPPGVPLEEVRAVQDWTVRPALRMVPGIADVVSFGGAIRELQVRIDPDLLRKYQVSLDDVTQALGTASSNGSGGLLRRGDEALVVRTLGLFNSLDDVRDVVVVARQGKPVRVGDVAEVINGARPRNGIVAFNDRDDVIEGIVQMTKGGNAAKVVDALHERVEEVNARLPEGYRVRPIYQRTELIGHTVATVGENLLVGAVLVTAILLVFLRNLLAAVIVAAVIPLSLMFAFILMHAMGVSANLISLGAVDFGVIIDSAVVMVEALMVRLAADAHLEHHGITSPIGRRMHALKQTCIELGSPIMFSKAIIIVAFLPIFTFQRVEGRIFTPVALTLSFALLGGLILTLTLVPTLLSYAMGKDMAEKESPWLHRLQEGYRKLLVRLQGRRRLTIAASGACLAAALALAPLLGSEFLPKLDEGNIWLTISLPQSSALTNTKEVERKVRAVLSDYPEVKAVMTHVGRPDDGTDPKGPNNIEVLIDLHPHGSWRFASKDALVDSMSARLAAIPGLPTNFSQVIQDSVEESLSGAKGEIAVKVFGPDLDVLETKGREIAGVLNRIQGSADVAALPVGGQSEVDIRLRREALARYGIRVADVNAMVQTALGGLAVNAYFEGERRYDVTLRFGPDFRDQVDDIANLPVALPDGKGSIPLGDLADVELRQGASRIQREAGSRAVIVKANLRGRDQGSFVAEAQRKVAAEVSLPAGYSMRWGGQFENQQRAIGRLKLIVPITLGLIFSLLFWAFRDIRPALLVLAMVPFTLIGGFAGLGIAGLHLSVSAAVGFIAVAGISVQNGVIMVEQVMEIARRGAPRSEAILDGAMLRLRPIVMTALMAGLGLLPAALSHGIGSETQRPFAVVIVGGIISATIFTLLLLPVLLSFGGKRSAPAADPAR
ncbi:CusA/CzcA family heavy metal efflux RND transporter [Zoogloea sp.]|uniref:efflux RND transporter permease subunit n=2 Tax=Zoogloea sp. TaxID=49181 RepID=UPI0011DA7B14|nr:CusA/CzcA family heavy metal efflux RND transporter [Zoogloea sp.]MBK6654784.1 efflux RND transporter permease subunit [Zoogloea sp.]TXG94911.1 MAG: efflux RND transporter permease subunit [Zoogloea sp.]